MAGALESAASAWAGLELVAPVDEGARNLVWQGRLRGEPVAVRRSRREPTSLDWEIELLGFLATNGFEVPDVLPAADGRRHVDGVVVQRWIDGRPPESAADWRLVAHELQRLHDVSTHIAQRPGCCVVLELATVRRSVDADLDAMPEAVADRVTGEFARFAHVPTAVIHGDPGPSNLRITAHGRVGLLDWDESRVDLTWHDLSPLGVQVLDDADHAAAQQLSHAWEAANAWTLEPAYARHRLRRLH